MKTVLKKTTVFFLMAIGLFTMGCSKDSGGSNNNNYNYGYYTDSYGRCYNQQNIQVNQTYCQNNGYNNGQGTGNYGNFPTEFCVGIYGWENNSMYGGGWGMGYNNGYGTGYVEDRRCTDMGNGRSDCSGYVMISKQTGRQVYCQ